MITKELIKKTAEYVRLKLVNEPTGHDWYHVVRVCRIAKKIHAQEGGDLDLIELTALLHDLGDYKNYDFNEKKGFLVLRGMMDVLEIDQETEEKILKIVTEAQYNGTETKVPSTIEGKIIQDADWLDALGAIGIARTFATGGQIGRVIYDPHRKPREKMTKAIYQLHKNDGTSFNYFYEKALKIPAMMNTKAGREMAIERTKFLNLFIKEFIYECQGDK